MKRDAMRALPISGTADARLQNRINISLVFNYLREQGPSYRAQIAGDLGLSAPAVSRAIGKLTEQGYVVEGASIHASNGRRVDSVRIDTGGSVVIGVDILGDYSKIVVSDLAGEILHTRRGGYLAESNDLVGDLSREIRSVLDALPGLIPGTPAIAAICVGVPAVVSEREGRPLLAPLYENLKGTDIVESLRSAFGVTIYCENIVRLATIGEAHSGAAKGYLNTVFIDVSHGVGAGIVVDGQLLRGSKGGAGEIGYFVLEPDGLEYSSATEGYLEHMASSRSLVETVNQELPVDSFEAVLEAAREGNEVVKPILGRFVDRLAMATINLVLVVEPEIVVIGGDIMRSPHAEELIVNPIRAHLRKTVPLEPPRLEASTLGENAGAVGAAVFAAETLLTGAYPYRHAVLSRTSP